MTDIQNKSDIQESQYDFPYHHLVNSARGVPSRRKVLKWGFEYLAYTDEIIAIIKNENPSSLLEVGCGDGYIIRKLVDAGVSNCLGVDAIAFAKAFSTSARFAVKDVASINEVFDVVLLCEVLEHIPDELESEFIQSVFDRVKPGGLLVLSVPSKVRPVHEKHFRHYTRIMLEELFRPFDDASKISFKYIFKESALHRYYLRLVENRFWSISIRIFDKIEWWVVKKFLLYGNENNGAHIIAVVRK